MATLAEIVRKQRKSGGGVIGSLASAIGQKTLETVDPRRMLNQRGLLTSLFPSLKAYEAKGSSSAERVAKPAGDSGSTSPIFLEMITKLDTIGDSTRLTAKNSMTLPGMSRDMNVMRQNIVKLVKLQGGKAATKADNFFLRSFEREKATESELQAAKERRATGAATKSTEVKESLSGGMLGGMLGLLGVGGLVSVAGKIISAITSIPSLIMSGLGTLTSLLSSGVKLVFDVAKATASLAGPGIKAAGMSLFNIIKSIAAFLISGPGLAVLGVSAVAGLLAYLLANEKTQYGPGVDTGMSPEDQMAAGGGAPPVPDLDSSIPPPQPTPQPTPQPESSAPIPASRKRQLTPSKSPTPAPTPAPASSLTGAPTPTPAPAASSTKPSPKNSVTSGEDGKLLDFIASKESSGDYNMVYGQGSNPNLTNMTIAEVLEYQKQLIAKGQKSSAVGRYQFIRSSLAEEAKAAGIDIEKEKFTPEMQDKLILHRLRRIRGLDDFRSGKITPQQFAENLSKEFASLPSPIKGGGKKSYYEGIAGNKALTNMESVYAAISPTPSTSGTQVAAASSEVIDSSRASQMQQPVVVNAPTTNVNQSRGGATVMGSMADTMDKELTSLLVGRMVGA